jgi:hypothetical protein
VDISVAWNIHAAHFRAVVLVALDEIGGHNAILENVLVVIDIVKERIEPGDALFHAAVDVMPIRAGQHARDHVEREHAVDGVVVGIDREGDAEIEQLPVGFLCAAAQVA